MFDFKGCLCMLMRAFSIAFHHTRSWFLNTSHGFKFLTFLLDRLNNTHKHSQQVRLPLSSEFFSQTLINTWWLLTSFFWLNCNEFSQCHLTTFIVESVGCLLRNQRQVEVLLFQLLKHHQDHRYSYTQQLQIKCL